MESANSPAVSTGTPAKSTQPKLGKNADKFTKSTYRFFDSLGSHSRGLMIVLGGILAVMLVAVMIMSQKERVSSEARGQLFLAQKQYDTELKALMPPAPKPPDTKDPKAKPPAPPVDDTEFKPFDVAAKMPGSVKAYQAVITQFPGTRAAYDAQMALGHLYLQHGQAAPAEELFGKATQASPRGVERALSFLALGYAQEATGKLKESIDAFTTALNTGEDVAKGDSLMGIARAYEGLHDLANARTTYDKVIAQLPNTEYARNAELYKAQAK